MLNINRTSEQNINFFKINNNKYQNILNYFKGNNVLNPLNKSKSIVLKLVDFDIYIKGEFRNCYKPYYEFKVFFGNNKVKNPFYTPKTFNEYLYPKQYNLLKKFVFNNKKSNDYIFQTADQLFKLNQNTKAIRVLSSLFEQYQSHDIDPLIIQLINKYFKGKYAANILSNFNIYLDTINADQPTK